MNRLDSLSPSMIRLCTKLPLTRATAARVESNRGISTYGLSLLKERVQVPSTALQSRNRLFASSWSKPPITNQVRMDAQHNNDRFRLDNVFNVKGKVALVTGGGSGIGLMATQALAVNGAKVYITGRTGDKLDRVTELYSKNIPGQIIPITADVTSKESIDSLTQTISSREKALHILINNAGISTATQNTDLQDPDELRKELFQDKGNQKNKNGGIAGSFEEWDTVFRTNVSQAFFMTVSFLPLLHKGSDVERGWTSTVVNISSISGIVNSAQHHFPYNASKAAANQLTKLLAHEIATSKLKIRMNNIAPGVFPSEMTAGESDAKQKNAIPSEKYQDKVPAGRAGRDEDMAGAVLFVTTNQYLTGQTVVVDGGYVLAAGTI